MAPRCKVFRFESYTAKDAPAPQKFADIDDIVAQWESDPAKATMLERARQWTVDSGLVGDAETLRSLRLRKGWSQQNLANKIGTSQSHIARIERGTENVTIQTCRRLATALEVDLTCLNHALLEQEKLVQAGPP